MKPKTYSSILLKDPDQIKVLIDKCRQENSQAQMEIYRLYYQAMFNVSYRIVNRFEDAEDVMQEAFIKAFKNLERFRGQSTFGAWLKRIVINESLNWLRKKNREDWRDLPVEKEEEEEFEDYDFTGLKAQKVLEAMNLLNERYRLVLNLHYIEGFDYEEIQEITGISYGNLRTLVSRAKSKLKNILEKHYGITK